MELINWFTSLGPWAWIIAGFALLGIELLVPGGVVVWFGLAAIAVGIQAFTGILSWQFQWLLFGVLSIAGVAVWTVYFKGKGGASDRPFLNARQQKLVGGTYSLDEPIVNGKGRMKVGDSWWLVEGPDMPAQSRVKVVSATATALNVEALDATK
ncbi:hypothetical protein ATL17_1481 [Maritalea mobilis]|uniref:Uncharacterized protein n=1 Tax=Maritalea mobilis TaxID=483324 RepID=A0A4R6VX36_9HYPH|nr:NfeD family protein [Maritalea mobilis]TDQ67466.1 hypothetical protein ATL17_1481 [Maritalea mobilis]